MGKGIQIGRIFGIPFRLDYSWFIIFIFITLILSLYVFPEDWPAGARWGIGIATSLLFFASVLAHELSHSLVSLRYGIPVKSITLFIFGGVAHISKEASEPGTELKMALAGPLCSLTLGALFYVLYVLLGGFSEYVAHLTSYLAWINGVLAGFNMIPGFPLDGGRVLRAIIWRVNKNYLRASYIATQAGYAVSYVFIGGGFLILFWQGLFDGLWLIILGFFLNGAARSSYRQTVLREALKGVSAQEVMTTNLPTVPRNLTIRELVGGPLLNNPSPVFLVTDGGSVKGILSVKGVKGVPKQHWDLTTAAHAMTPVDKLKTVSPADDALSVLEGMEAENTDVAAVVSGGRATGIILLDVLLQYAHRRSELKG